MAVDFSSYSFNFLSHIFPSSKSKYGIEAAAFNQLGQILLNKSISSHNIQSNIPAEISEEEKERLEKICDQFLG